ncbi:Coenzyme F420 hydrogenase/dehydrogenase, beta subunit C-terminal domain [Clostridium diolis]|uniref:F420H(2):quinone oxidoreductase n=1 Tax=Clostridium diolis TaxID=223919 RepID=A0AAV3V6T6_9CLOT|nr:Coenzyme F420 hydrogenase/dehydrogenase, beta subunit C-terminal domain [Clostridium diolis]QES72336.1 (4Fe-4S)-binding protein [Clostridium diolis]GEA30036.1 F420H(2):quinone oxidoreductase [Clostridium diolis]
METDNYPQAFACYNDNIEIRMKSTSGGIFTLLADHIIQNYNGVVFGAAFDSDFSIHHICVNRVEDLDKLRGSKYPQSLIGETYKEVRQYLQDGTVVLFVGTPCQVEGLKSFMEKEYDNLYCMDFVCHGVASNTVWNEYVDELSKSGTIKNIVFKSKPKGWKKWYFSVEYVNHNYQIRGCMNKFMKSYLSYCNIRPSCFNCHFKGLNRNSDFTISDCWGIGEENEKLNDDYGLSALLVQNSRALEIFEEIKDNLHYERYDSETLMAGNWTAVSSVKKNDSRDLFFEFVKEKGGVKAIDKFFRPSAREWFWYFRARLLGKEK